MDLLLILIVSVIILCILLWRHEKHHLIYHMKYACSLVLGKPENIQGLPTPEHVRDQVCSLLDSIHASTYTLLDFGCGDGDMIETCLPHVKHVIGIELDEQQATRTKARFHKEIEEQKVTIHAMNMLDYSFDTIPSVLYMYEPLWMMERNEALSIYNKVISAYQSVPDSYIIYVSRLQDPLLNESFFSSYSIIHQSRVPRMLGWDGNYLYLLKRSLLDKDPQE